MSQDYNSVLATDTLKNSRIKLTARDDAVASSFSGTAYPASPYVGQQCYRTDYGKLYICTAITPSTVWEEIVGGSKFIVAGGTANAIAVNFTPDISITDGLVILVRAAYANTITTPTMAVDGGTPATITKKGGTALEAGDIAGAGHVLQLCYNATATKWELMNPAISSNTVSFVTYKYIATEGQTSFSGSDYNSAILSYYVNLIQVFLNGVLLDKTDYTATTGTSVVLSSACTVMDELVIQSFSKFDIANTYTKAEVDGAFVDFLDTSNSWSKAQSGAQVSLTSSSNHIATDASLSNNFIHTMTEDSTLDNPTNIVAGTYYTWVIIQHATAAKTLALGNYFQTVDGNPFVGISTTTGAINTIYGFAKTSTAIDISIIKNGT